MTAIMKTKVLFLDKPSRSVLFKEYLGKNKTLQLVSTNDPINAFKKIKDTNIDLIVLGGDIDGDYRSVVLANNLVDNNLSSNKHIFIATWDADEAKILRNIFPNALYMPFCRSLVDVIKKVALYPRFVKQRNKKNA